MIGCKLSTKERAAVLELQQLKEQSILNCIVLLVSHNDLDLNLTQFLQTNKSSDERIKIKVSQL